MMIFCCFCQKYVNPRITQITKNEGDKKHDTLHTDYHCSICNHFISSTEMPTGKDKVKPSILANEI